MLQEIVIKLELDSTSSTGVRLCLGEISSEELYRVCREAAHVRTSVCAAAGQCPRARCVSPQPTCAHHSESTEPALQGSAWEWGKRRARDCSGARATAPGGQSREFLYVLLLHSHGMAPGSGAARALKRSTCRVCMRRVSVNLHRASRGCRPTGLH